jgi:hypothetical protein
LETSSPPRAPLLLAWLLRFGAAFTMSAFLAVFLPVRWMAATHGWLGLGEFPQSPLTDYLARSVAALYGFHGVLLLLLSLDVQRSLPVIRFIGVMNVLLGAMLLGIDLHAGMPAWWTLGEGPPLMAVGVAVLMLARRTPRAG